MTPLWSQSRGQRSAEECRWKKRMRRTINYFDPLMTRLRPEVITLLGPVTLFLLLTSFLSVCMMPCISPAVLKKASKTMIYPQTLWNHYWFSLFSFCLITLIAKILFQWADNHNHNNSGASANPPSKVTKEMSNFLSFFFFFLISVN